MPPRKHRIPPEKTAQARSLRRDAPFPERILWRRLRAGQLDGRRFRRQHVVGPYIADFYCPDASLLIELDGLSHEGCDAYDADRTRFLEAQGFRVIRFSNDEVVRSVDDVVYRIGLEVGLPP
jgi:very-short-patch-repair endonuclease